MPSWHSDAVDALVDVAVSELRAGHSPHSSIRALAELGTHARPLGHDAARALDGRLSAAVAAWADDYHRAWASSTHRQVANPAQHTRGIADTLFARLPESALTGCPHPGPWYPSSVDVVACAVHGDEASPLDCLRMLVHAHLAEVLDRASEARTFPAGDGTLAEQVLAAHDSRPTPVEDGHPCHPDDTLPTGDTAVIAAVWLGIAALAAWQEHASATSAG